MCFFGAMGQIAATKSPLLFKAYCVAAKHVRPIAEELSTALESEDYMKAYQLRAQLEAEFAKWDAFLETLYNGPVQEATFNEVSDGVDIKAPPTRNTAAAVRVPLRAIRACWAACRRRCGIFRNMDACRAVVQTTTFPIIGDRFQPLIYMWSGRRGPILSRGTLFCDRPNFTQYRSFYAGPGRFAHAQGCGAGVLRAHRRPGPPRHFVM